MYDQGSGDYGVNARDMHDPGLCGRELALIRLQTNVAREDGGYCHA